MLSISTSWDYKPDMDIKAWMEQIKGFGINSIELGYTHSYDQLKQIEDLLEPMQMTVNSIHNFCPLPNDEPSKRHPSNYYRLSSLDAHECEKAIEWTNACVDTAARVNAGFVVIHAGTLELEEDPSVVMLDLFKQGQYEVSKAQDLIEQFKKIRKEKAGPYIEVLDKSLETVCDYAKSKNVKIGLETRYYPIEMPNFDEIEYFLNRLDNEAIGYWHDVGHAEINSRLGLVDHEDFLKKYGEKMIGVHLHGMKVWRDHLAPYDGDMDIEKYLPYFKGDMIKVIEARYADAAQVQNGVEKLLKYYG